MTGQLERTTVTTSSRAVSCPTVLTHQPHGFVQRCGLLEGELINFREMPSESSEVLRPRAPPEVGPPCPRRAWPGPGPEAPVSGLERSRAQAATGPKATRADRTRDLRERYRVSSGLLSPGALSLLAGAREDG